MSGLLTPVGDRTTLADLDLSNPDTQLSILTYDKHQTIEGLFIEPFAMNYMTSLEHFGVKPVDVVTVFAKHTGPGTSRCVFIWCRNSTKESQDYIGRLQSLHPKSTYVVEFSEAQNDFLCFKPDKPDTKFPLQEYLRKKRKLSFIRFPDIAEHVRDDGRHKSAFWGRLTTAFKSPEEFKNEVILNRLLKNFAIQPFFKYLWDLDRIISYKEQFWEIELKHKYPFRNNQSGELTFGINLGQARLVRDLANKGLNTLHLILVKPTWRKDVAPGYIFNQRDVYKHVLLIGMVINKEKIDGVLSGRVGTSDSSTSFTGTNTLNYLPMPAKDFYFLGTYEDPIETVSKNILSLLESEHSGADVNLLRVTDKLLLDNRL